MNLWDTHFTLGEIECPCCRKAWPDLFTNPIYREFFLDLEALRTEFGKPLPISRGGGARCPGYQLSLYNQGKTSALVSPHLFLAVDIDLPDREETLRFAAAVESCFPEMRMGVRQYVDRGQTFVHLDRAYLVQPKTIGTASWARGVRW